MHPDPSVLLTFSLHQYSVLVLCRPPVLYHFHSIHYQPHTFPTPIWTHQLTCYCSQSSSIIVHLTALLFSARLSHNSPNWLASPPSHPLLAPLFPHVYYHFPPVLAILLKCLSRNWRHYIPWKQWEPLIQWQCQISLALLQGLNLSAVVCCNIMF
jgi:hypothetical protein